MQRAIELVVSRLENNTTTSALGSEAEKTPEIPYLLSDRIFVRHKNRMVKLYLHDILYIEAERSYCRILTDETEFLLSMPLKVLAEKLDTNHFFRIHRSYIVNLKQIDAIAETHIVIVKKAIPIGKSYKEAFTQQIRMI